MHTYFPPFYFNQLIATNQPNERAVDGDGKEKKWWKWKIEYVNIHIAIRGHNFIFTIIVVDIGSYLLPNHFSFFSPHSVYIFWNCHLIFLLKRSIQVYNILIQIDGRRKDINILRLLPPPLLSINIERFTLAPLDSGWIYRMLVYRQYKCTYSMIRTCFSLSFLRLRGLFMMATYVTQIRLKLEHVSPIKTCNFYSVSCHTLFLPCVCVCVWHTINVISFLQWHYFPEFRIYYMRSKNVLLLYAICLAFFFI